VINIMLVTVARSPATNLQIASAKPIEASNKRRSQDQIWCSLGWPGESVSGNAPHLDITRQA
jgi:hypothetical protein